MATTDLPLVSIVTCTYQRQQFFENLKNMVRAQDYPHNKLEWIIIDDTPDLDSSAVFPKDLDGIRVEYIYLKKKIALARKRTLLNHKANGVYIVNMDDDDYYPPCRVSHAVERLRASGKAIAGNSKMFMYFTKDGSVYQLGPYRENHGTAATLAFTKEYTKTHDFGHDNYAEEGVFTSDWSTPMENLDPMKTVLAMSHTNNTIEKTMFLEERHGHLGRTVHETKLTIDNFVNPTKEKEVYDFYKGLKYEYKENQYTKEVIDKMEKNTKDSLEKYRQLTGEKMAQELALARDRYAKEMLFVHNIHI